MRRFVRFGFLLILAVPGCAGPPAAGKPGFQTSGASAAVDALSDGRGPAVYTRAAGIAAPMAGISRACTPSTTGIDASCRAAR